MVDIRKSLPALTEDRLNCLVPPSWVCFDKIKLGKEYEKNPCPTGGTVKRAGPGWTSSRIADSMPELFCLPTLIMDCSISQRQTYKTLSNNQSQRTNFKLNYPSLFKLFPNFIRMKIPQMVM